MKHILKMVWKNLVGPTAVKQMELWRKSLEMLMLVQGIQIAVTETTNNNNNNKSSCFLKTWQECVKLLVHLQSEMHVKCNEEFSAVHTDAAALKWIRIISHHA